jgi:broad specificity phosphatase PhoE
VIDRLTLMIESIRERAHGTIVLVTHAAFIQATLWHFCGARLATISNCGWVTLRPIESWALVRHEGISWRS